MGAEAAPELCVASLGPDTDTLLTAFGLLVDDRPGLVLEIIGEGPLEASVRRRAEQLGFEDRVHIRQQLLATEAHAIVARSAVLVLPAPGRATAHGGHRLGGLLGDGIDPAPPVIFLGVAGPPRVGSGHPRVVFLPLDDPVSLARAIADLLVAPRSVQPVKAPPQRTTASRRSLFRRPRS